MITIVRVDNRLLHGQVLETWLPRLGAATVLVADDEAARSPLAQAAMTLCCPSATVEVRPVAEVDFAEVAARPEPVLVLVRDVAGLGAAVHHGLTPERARRLNLGNVHFQAGRKPLTPSVYLGAAELEALQALAAAGFEVEARALPSDPPVGLAELARRYAAAR